jgi:hypothetical protein
MNGTHSVSDNTYDVWVDGVLLADNATFRNAFTVINEFAILNSSTASTQTVYFDNIILRSDIPTAIVQAGDFNGDGNVDGNDFVIWQMHFPTASGAALDDGDADGDGDVDGADFVVWQTNFPLTSSSGMTPVPEPASIMIVLGAVLVLARHVASKRQADGE